MSMYEWSLGRKSMIEFLPNPSPLSFTGKATLVLINTWGFPIARLIKVQQVAFDNQS